MVMVIVFWHNSRLSDQTGLTGCEVYYEIILRYYYDHPILPLLRL